MRALCLAGLVFTLLLAGPAAALAITIEEPPPATPEGDPVEATITVTGSCDLVDDTLHVLVGMSTAPSWLTGSRDRVGGVHPDRLNVTEADCVDGEWSKGAVLHFGADDEAPAFEPAPVVVWARVGNAMVNATTNVTAGFLARVDVRGPMHAPQVEPGASAMAEITLENTGNTLLQVTSTVLVAPEGWQIVAPHPLRILPVRDGGTAHVLNVLIHPVTSSLRSNVAGSVVVQVDAVPVADPDHPGTSATVEVPVHVTGINVPAPSTVLVGLVATAALLLRRP